MSTPSKQQAPAGGRFQAGSTDPRRARGRPKGTQNKVNAEFRETVRKLLEDNADNVALWLKQVAEGIEPVLDAEGKVAVQGRPGNPDAALGRLAALAEFASPKLSRSEVTGDAGGPLNVIIHRLG